MLKLSKRLTAAAQLLRGGLTVDIGTDHAYLPAFLVQSGKCERCIASDIGRGPLLNAAKTVENCGLEDRIELRLSDGLNEISPDEAEEIAICGMGGNLIEEILTAAPWVKREGMHLCLQPMTHFENVRAYLFSNGFEIGKETVCFDEGRFYLTVSADYTGFVPEKNPGREYFGDTPFADEGFCALSARTYKRIKTRLDSIKKVGRFPQEQEILSAAVLYYERMKNNDGTGNL